MELLERLRMRYPNHHFEMDHVTAVISFSYDDMCITDPFSSSCSRFRVSPKAEYGLLTEDAIEIFDHNLPLEATYGPRPE